MNRVACSAMRINAALIMVAIVDLVTTVVWLHNGTAAEANPIMSGVLSYGLPLFIVVKCATLSAYTYAMWIYIRRNAGRAYAMSSFALYAYIALYVISFWCVNQDLVVKALHVEVLLRP